MRRVIKLIDPSGLPALIKDGVIPAGTQIQIVSGKDLEELVGPAFMLLDPPKPKGPRHGYRPPEIKRPRHL